jgi:hypothetical protein
MATYGNCDDCSFVPLTTTFTPPSHCTEHWTPDYARSVTSDYIDLTRNYTAPDCLPSQYSTQCHTGCNACSVYGLSNVSPGVCPAGYEVAKTVVQASQGNTLLLSVVSRQITLHADLRLQANHRLPPGTRLFSLQAIQMMSEAARAISAVVV